MIKEIKYNGYTANPSDYECPDGDLAIAMGMINEDGALKPLMPPAEILELEAENTIKFIHETAHFRHFIIWDGKNLKLKWMDDEGSVSDAKELHTFTAGIRQVTAIGNTLVVLADDGMHYFLWKGESGEYLYLGTQIPECPLSFGLQGEMVRDDEFSISFLAIGEGNIWNEFNGGNKRDITAAVLAKVNKFIADNSTKKGKFIFPFLLRYAYRLYDGTLTKHSAPILMVASSDLVPQVFWNCISGAGSYSSATLQVVAMLHQIDYAVVSQSDLNSLLNWKDIVTSVDVFISKPIYTYDQNGECTKFVKVDDSDCYAICKHTNQAVSTETHPLKYQKQSFSKLYAFTFNPDTLEYPTGRLMLPQRDEETVKNDIKNCSQFYLLESIKIEELKTERTVITVKEDYLQSLVTREVMTDDYDSHDKLMPEYAFLYNARLNVANIHKTLFAGHHPNATQIYSDGFVSNSLTAPEEFDSYAVKIYVYIRQDGKEIVVESESGTYGPKTPFLFFYYPNTNAYKAVVVRGNGYVSNANFYEIPLEKHAFLNGVFYFGGWKDISKTTDETITASNGDGRLVQLPNKIYTSEVNNPFCFPVLGINTVGTGTILGISTAAKALSEGQFGQFPLYAFTTEGVWALEVSDTGTYSAKQPIARDVVINPESITQIDSAVLFATDRGIMHISGSTVQCISDSINMAGLYTIKSLPKADKLIEIFNGKANESEQMTLDDITLLPFDKFLQGCRMLYDYTNQHIIVYNASARYAYVFSLKSKSWGMMRSNIVDNVNSYPEALAMADGAKLVDFSKSQAETATSLIITRPFKVGDLNSFKTINTLIQRGMFRSTHVQQVLYGSNDLENWQTVWSSADRIMRGLRGTPYKAYILALICSFDKVERLYGCTVGFEPRMTNQLR